MPLLAWRIQARGQNLIDQRLHRIQLRACATRGLRSGGNAEANAARTVRRCTPCRSARAWMDNSSRRASRRIAANSSARLDLNPPPQVQPDHPDAVTSVNGHHSKPGPGIAVTMGPTNSVPAIALLDDPDGVAKRAIAAGARALFPVEDQPYGWRQGRVVDPFGHHWLIGRPLN